MNKPFTIFTDNAHGWLQVTPADCAVIGLSANDFTRYSYRDDRYWYLEEDLDAAEFIGAFVLKYHCTPVIRESHTHGSSAIRRKQRLGSN